MAMHERVRPAIRGKLWSWYYFFFFFFVFGIDGCTYTPVVLDSLEQLQYSSAAVSADKDCGFAMSRRCGCWKAKPLLRCFATASICTCFGEDLNFPRTDERSKKSKESMYLVPVRIIHPSIACRMVMSGCRKQQVVLLAVATALLHKIDAMIWGKKLRTSKSRLDSKCGDAF